MPTPESSTLIRSSNQNPPVILAFGALDPSGGGGLQADIETAASLGCHCAPVATALCTNGGPDATATLAVDSTILIEQARSVLENMPVAAIKVGFTGSVANVEALHSILRDYPHIPVVLHPSLNLWDKDQAEQSGLLAALTELLVAQATTVNVSISEIRQLAPEADTLDATAQAVISRGCTYVLVCNTSDRNDQFQNSLYRAQGLFKHYHWDKAAPTCHGSSSTLGSGIAAYLGHNCHPISAVEQGQNYAWQTLIAARHLGSGSAVPHRFFWADQETISTSAGEPPADKSTH